MDCGVIVLGYYLVVLNCLLKIVMKCCFFCYYFFD